MSNLTNIIVITLDQEEDITRINNWFAEAGFKVLKESNVHCLHDFYSNCYRQFPKSLIEEFINWFNSTTFTDDVQLLIESENLGDSVYTLYNSSK